MTGRVTARAIRLLAFAGLVSAWPAWTQAASPIYTAVNESGQVVMTIENHRFSPAEIHVRAGQKAQILVRNLDATAEEFDSTTLKVEKVIAGRSEAVVRLPSLDPGSYPFVGEYNSETAKGVVVAE